MFVTYHPSGIKYIRNLHFPWPPKTWQDDCGLLKSAFAHGVRATHEEHLGAEEMADWDFWDLLGSG